MAYTKARADWIDYPNTTTPITAANLETIEQGIFDAAAAADTALAGQFATHTLTAAASVTLSADYPAQSLTMTSATTLVAPTVSDGHAIVLWLSGAHVPTWWAGVKWAGGTAPTYASAGTLYHLLKLGGAWYASGQAYS